MQIVIDIPKEIYELIMSDESELKGFTKAVKNGTVLPKHERLISANALKDNINNWYDLVNEFKQSYIIVSQTDIIAKIDNAPTILEATKGE